MFFHLFCISREKKTWLNFDHVFHMIDSRPPILQIHQFTCSKKPLKIHKFTCSLFSQKIQIICTFFLHLLLLLYSTLCKSQLVFLRSIFVKEKQRKKPHSFHFYSWLWSIQNYFLLLVPKIFLFWILIKINYFEI